jgi:capsular polysaccharide biosynthesis protein
MELKLYLDILKRRAFVIAIVAAVAMLVVAIAGIVIQPVYTARTTVRVLLDAGLVDFMRWEDYNRRQLNTYSEILKSEPILEGAISRLSPRTSSLTVVELREQVKVEVIPDT